LIAVEYHTDLEQVQSDPALIALLGAKAQAAPFDRLDWWQGLARHCGLSPWLAVARDGDALAVLPLSRNDRSVTALANWYTFRIRPLASAQSDAAGLLTAIASDLPRHCDSLVLAPLSDEDGSATLLKAAFARAGWTTFLSRCDTNHILTVNSRTAAEYMQDLPGPLRTALARKGGKLSVEIFREFNSQAWSDYEDIYASSWKPAEGSPAFLRAFAEAEGAAGRLRLGIARAEGRAVAAQFWTVEGDSAFIHKLAHRPEADALSPGTVLTAALMRHVIDEDHVTLVDFGTGDDPYKRDWMNGARSRWRLAAYRPKIVSNWPKIACELVKQAPRRLAGETGRG